MSESFTFVATVLISLAIGLGGAGVLWWFTLRSGQQRGSASKSHGESLRRTNAPLILIAVALGFCVSVAVLYGFLNKSTPTVNSVANNGAFTPEIGALASAMGLTPASSATRTPTSASGGDLEAMTARLAKRLQEKTPQDYEGWALLARSYVELGRDTDAVAAYERAEPIRKRDPAVQAEYEALKQHTTGSKPSTSAGNALIAGQVIVANAMKTHVTDGGIVFVIARTPGQVGAPIAVKKIVASVWPAKFTLSDADSMLPSTKLSEMKSVELIVRFSKTGDAAAQPGDVESEMKIVSSGQQNVSVELARLLVRL